MDPITLWDALYWKYHLPNFPLVAPTTIVDLGANAGYAAANLAATYPSATIIAVEMDAANASLCARNLAQFGERCRVVQAAVWSETGSISYSGSNVHSYSVHDHSGGAKVAPAITLPQLFTDQGVEHVDYLKMDIEGAEAEVLASPTGWIERVQNISLEVHPPATLEGCRARLNDLGFVTEIHRHHPSALVARRSNA